MTAVGLQDRGAASPAAILDAYERPVMMVGADFRVAAANRAFKSLMAADESVVGRRCFEVSHGRTTPCVPCDHDCPLRWRQSEGEPARAVHRHRTATGHRRFEIESRPLFSVGSSRPSGALIVLNPLQEAPQRAVPAALVGAVPEAAELRDRLLRVAASDLPILLVGEVGTGKDSIALFVRRVSSRWGRAFDRVSGAEDHPSDLLGDLFGSWRSRPTGQLERVPGRVESCREGTLLISELESCPEEVIGELRRWVTRGLYQARGDLEMSEADVRLIFTTTELDVRRSEESLLLEMALFPVAVPPLRTRLVDLEEIVQRLAEESPELASIRLDERSWDLLRAYDFPGNLRELRSILRRASLLAGAEAIRPCHLPGVSEAISLATPPARPREGVLPLEEIERRYLTWADSVFDGPRDELAKRLGISERALYRRLRRSLRRRSESGTPHPSRR